MIFNNLKENPYLWIITTLLGLIAAIISIYTWFDRKKKKEISYYKNSYKIIDIGQVLTSSLKLLYKEKEIKDLVITKYAIWNSGDEVLNSSDIVVSKPLQINIDNEDAKILDAKIIQRTDECNNFLIEEQEEKYIKIKFDYIDLKDGIVIQIIHTGEKNILGVDCKIKGGKKIKWLNENPTEDDIKRKNVKAYLSIILSLISSCATCIMGAIILQRIQNKAIYLIIIILMFFSMLNTGFQLLDTVFDRAYKNIVIPKKLKENINTNEFEN